MPKPRYDLVVLDLDGTLLDQHSRVTARTRASLERASAAGVAIAVATGRSYPLVRYFTDGLPLTGPQITYNGAVVVDPVTGKPTFLQAIPAAFVGPVLAFLRARAIFSCYYTEDTIFIEGHAPLERALVPPDFPHQPVVVDDLTGLVHLPCLKLVAVAKPESISLLRPAAEAAFAQDLYVTQTAPVLLEFLHPAVSKGAALREVMAYLGVDPARVIAFGDGHNDIGLLQEAGTGVAMANAEEEVRAIADLVAPANSEDGIAQVLDRVLWE
ncbi:MAG TPA: Cof-type HAD-IIB family hydrolase [Chloroflexota bacterium]|nr:Cof-type HAD-IIB family hydrolase [Chloroflexota bacterium]